MDEPALTPRNAMMTALQAHLYFQLDGLCEATSEGG